MQVASTITVTITITSHKRLQV